jgi:hypothetical protein
MALTHREQALAWSSIHRRLERPHLERRHNHRNAGLLGIDPVLLAVEQGQKGSHQVEGTNAS